MFAEDYAGIIMKIDFGSKSGMHPDEYLAEMKRGEWTGWNTPRRCRELERIKAIQDIRRKLLLYDPTRQGITVEVEIDAVTQNDSDPGYPWTHKFAEHTLHILEDPIPLSRIESIEGFNRFGRDRSAYRNITHEQYRMLTGRQAGCRPV